MYADPDIHVRSHDMPWISFPLQWIMEATHPNIGRDTRRDVKIGQLAQKPH